MGYATSLNPEVAELPLIGNKTTILVWFSILACVWLPLISCGQSTDSSAINKQALVTPGNRQEIISSSLRSLPVLKNPQPAPAEPGNYGVVSIEVIVDKQGKVTSATFHPSRSTTTNPNLVKAAIDAALLWEWKPDLKKSTEIKGWIEFTFRPQ